LEISDPAKLLVAMENMPVKTETSREMDDGKE